MMNYEDSPIIFPFLMRFLEDGLSQSLTAVIQSNKHLCKAKVSWHSQMQKLKKNAFTESLWCKLYKLFSENGMFTHCYIMIRINQIYLLSYEGKFVPLQKAKKKNLLDGILLANDL